MDDLAIPAAAALLHVFQLAMDASMVGKYRQKFKINPPEVNGPPEFKRAMRAQANGLEWALIIEVLMWLCAVYVHPVVATVLMLIYIYARHKYTKGYIEDAEKRRPGFYITLHILKLYLVLDMAGIANALLKRYLDIDVPQMALTHYYGAK